MMSAVVYLAAVVGLSGWPVYHLLRSRLAVTLGGEGGVGLLPLVGGFGGAALLTLGVMVVSLRVGVRRIREAETFVGEGAA